MLGALKNLSFALSCGDNQHQRQQGGLSTGVLCCLVSIWLSDILLDFISWLERSEFSLKSWQAEQTKFPRYFPVLAANCKEESPCWALMDERALEQQWHARTQNCAGAEDSSSQECWLTLTFPPAQEGEWHRGNRHCHPMPGHWVTMSIPLPWHHLQIALPKAPKPPEPGRSQKSQCGLGNFRKRYKGKYCHLSNDSFTLLQLFFYQYLDVFPYSHYKLLIPVPRHQPESPLVKFWPQAGVIKEHDKLPRTVSKKQNVLCEIAPARGDSFDFVFCRQQLSNCPGIPFGLSEQNT